MNTYSDQQSGTNSQQQGQRQATQEDPALQAGGRNSEIDGAQRAPGAGETLAGQDDLEAQGAEESEESEEEDEQSEGGSQGL